MVILKIEGVDGEYPGTDMPELAKGIQLTSINWGASTMLSRSAAGFAAGTATFDRISFSKSLDKATGKLMEYCATGEPIKSATIYYLRTGSMAEGKYITMRDELQTIIVSGYSLNGSTGGDPGESISLSPAKVKFIYQPLDEKGKRAPSVMGEWDLAQSLGSRA